MMGGQSRLGKEPVGFLGWREIEELELEMDGLDCRKAARGRTGPVFRGADLHSASPGGRYLPIGCWRPCQAQMRGDDGCDEWRMKT